LKAETRLSLLRLLLNFGASTTVGDVNGDSALHYVVMNKIYFEKAAMFYLVEASGEDGMNHVRRLENADGVTPWLVRKTRKTLRVRFL
jgi:hypothetical protein